MCQVILPLGVSRLMETGLSEENITPNLQPFDNLMGHILNLLAASYENQDT